VPAEFIYTTYKLSRHYPPDRTVLEDISISFYPGAKIGVIGANGSGKSSLLRIMAGLDDGYNGEARLTPGFSVGYLSQEPQLDPTKTVKENVLDGVREIHGLIEQYNAVMARWSDPDADSLQAPRGRMNELRPGAERREPEALHYGRMFWLRLNRLSGS
jgi:energy-dependent translational throttle protein EttA